jgi:hypothetical protein
MAHGLNMYRRADTPGVLDPLGRSLFADKKTKRDKINSEASQSYVRDES